MAYARTRGPEFDGENGDVETFIKDFSYEAELYGLDVEAQARTIVHCLSGKALVAYKTLNDTEKKDIELIKKKLRETCVLSPEHYLNKFHNRTLGPNEKIGQFCRALEGLLDKAKCTGDMRETLLRWRLISVVPESTRQFMELLSDKSWDELVTIFEKQTDYNFHKPSSDYVDVNRISANYSSYNRNSFSTPTRFGGECFYCGKIGHRKFECRVRELDMRDRSGSDRDFWANSYNNVSSSNSRQSFVKRPPEEPRDNVRRAQTFNIDAVEEQYFQANKEDDFAINTVKCESHYINDKRRNLIRVVASIDIDDNKVAVPMQCLSTVVPLILLLIRVYCREKRPKLYEILWKTELSR